MVICVALPPQGSSTNDRVAIRNAAARAVHLKEAKWRNDRQSSKFSGVFVAGREETACVFPLGREYRWATNGHPPSSFVYPRVARRTAFFPVTLGIVPGWSSFLPSPPPPLFPFSLSLFLSLYRASYSSLASFHPSASLVSSPTSLHSRLAVRLANRAEDRL